MTQDDYKPRAMTFRKLTQDVLRAERAAAYDDTALWILARLGRVDEALSYGRARAHPLERLTALAIVHAVRPDPALLADMLVLLEQFPTGRAGFIARADVMAADPAQRAALMDETLALVAGLAAFSRMDGLLARLVRYLLDADPVRLDDARACVAHMTTDEAKASARLHIARVLHQRGHDGAAAALQAAANVLIEDKQRELRERYGNTGYFSSERALEMYEEREQWAEHADDEATANARAAYQHMEGQITRGQLAPYAPTPPESPHYPNTSDYYAAIQALDADDLDGAAAVFDAAQTKIVQRHTSQRQRAAKPSATRNWDTPQTVMSAAFALLTRESDDVRYNFAAHEMKGFFGGARPLIDAAIAADEGELDALHGHLDAVQVAINGQVSLQDQTLSRWLQRYAHSTSRSPFVVMAACVSIGLALEGEAGADYLNQARYIAGHGDRESLQPLMRYGWLLVHMMQRGAVDNAMEVFSNGEAFCRGVNSLETRESWRGYLGDLAAELAAWLLAAGRPDDAGRLIEAITLPRSRVRAHGALVANAVRQGDMVLADALAAGITSGEERARAWLRVAQMETAHTSAALDRAADALDADTPHELRGELASIALRLSVHRLIVPLLGLPSLAAYGAWVESHAGDLDGYEDGLADSIREALAAFEDG